ncbi:MAG: leucine-rich repeat protein [Clostridia bacterium]|nr:leucine-rich repeat protein [Clostridia bacterium]
MKKITSVVIISLVLAFLLAGSVAAAKVTYEYEAKTSSEVSWTIYDTGELIISGKAAISGYNAGEAPWYKYRNSVTSITIKSGVTGIGKYAFYGMRYVTEIDIPSTVTSLGMYAFNKCEDLEYIELPSKITGIPTGAFQGCESLEEIELPSSLKSIRSNAFQDCVSLIEITIPGGVDTLGNNIFVGCISLEDVYFMGDAPSTVGEVLFDDDGDDVTVYYTKDASGFTKLPWRAYNTDTFSGEYEGGNDDDDDGWLDSSRDDDSDIWYGDLNEDGKVNTADRRILTYVLAFREDFDLDDYEDRGDVDEDGEITPMDDIILSRYIDGWKNYELPN